MKNFERGPCKNHSREIWGNSVLWFRKMILLTDDERTYILEKRFLLDMFNLRKSSQQSKKVPNKREYISSWVYYANEVYSVILLGRWTLVGLGKEDFWKFKVANYKCLFGGRDGRVAARMDG